MGYFDTGDGGFARTRGNTTPDTAREIRVQQAGTLSCVSTRIFCFLQHVAFAFLRFVVASG